MSPCKLIFIKMQFRYRYNKACTIQGYTVFFWQRVHHFVNILFKIMGHFHLCRRCTLPLNIPLNGNIALPHSTPGSQWSDFYHCKFCLIWEFYMGGIIQYVLWCPVSFSQHNVWWSLILLFVTVICSVMGRGNLNCIPLEKYFTIYLSTSWWTYILLLSYVKQLWTFAYKCFCGHMFSLFLGIIRVKKLPDYFLSSCESFIFLLITSGPSIMSRKFSSRCCFSFSSWPYDAFWINVYTGCEVEGQCSFYFPYGYHIYSVPFLTLPYSFDLYVLYLYKYQIVWY